MSDYIFLNQPESIPHTFVEAWNRRDAPQIAALFDEDAEFVNVTGLWWHNRQDIEKAHDYGLRTIFNESLLTLIRTKTKYLAEHIAVVHAKVKLSGQTSTLEIDNPGERRTVFTFVVHRVEGRWRCAAAQNTDIVPGMETHVQDEQSRLSAVDYRKSVQ